jgi:hypothetical protein
MTMTTTTTTMSAEAWLRDGEALCLDDLVFLVEGGRAVALGEVERAADAGVVLAGDDGEALDVDGVVDALREAAVEIAAADRVSDVVDEDALEAAREAWDDDRLLALAGEAGAAGDRAGALIARAAYLGGRAALVAVNATFGGEVASSPRENRRPG